MSFENIIKTEIKIRKGAAQEALWAKKSCSEGKVGLRAKIRILESMAYPVLTYGAKTWACTAKQFWEIETTQQGMLHSILGIKILETK